MEMSPFIETSKRNGHPPIPHIELGFVRWDGESEFYFAPDWQVILLGRRDLTHRVKDASGNVRYLIADAAIRGWRKCQECDQWSKYIDDWRAWAHGEYRV